MQTMKKLPVLTLLQFVLAVFLSVGIATFLGPCVHADGKIGPCKAISQHLIALGALMAASATVMLLVRSPGVRIALAR